MLIHALGIDPILLGKQITTLSDHQPFGPTDRKLFIPGPGPEFWRRYTGDTSCIEDGLGDRFTARFIYFSTKDDDKINSLVIFPDDHTGYSLTDSLDKLFGVGNIAHGAMLGAVRPYHYFWTAQDEDNMVQIYYLDPVSCDNGLEHISFRFFYDMETLHSYKLVYRSWAQD